MLVPADKACNNVLAVCYLDIVIKELSGKDKTKTYVECTETLDKVLKEQC